MTIKIKIPEEEGNLLLKIGDKINFGQPFFEKKINEKIIINVAEKLKIKPKNIFNFLKKFVGDSVKKDELLAFKKDFFSIKKILSPVDGLIKEINHEEGTIIIEIKKDRKKLIYADFEGEVETIKNNFLELKVKKIISDTIKKTAYSQGGKCLYLVDDLKQITNLTINEIENKIIILNEINDVLLSKLETLGAKILILNQSFKSPENKKIIFIKNINFWNKIIKEKLPYCYLDSFFDKIYFYY